MTSRSGFTRRPFRHKAQFPQVRTRSFTAQPLDLRHLSLDHESFAVRCPLALLGTASYPVLVHRLAVSLHASFPHSFTLTQLRFASFAMINLREDFHLQGRTHAGRTTRNLLAEANRHPLSWRQDWSCARLGSQSPRRHCCDRASKPRVFLPRPGLGLKLMTLSLAPPYADYLDAEEQQL